MSTSGPPQGQRFSHIYISHPQLLPDSVRMRRRLGSLLFRYTGARLRDYLNREVGTKLSNSGSGLEDYWPNAMEHLELRDVLDAVTVAAKLIDAPGDLIDEVRRVFAEEKVRYSVDDRGGIHFAVDAEFEQSRVAAIRQLSGSRYVGVRERFDEAYKALDGVPPDPKSAIRNVFFAAEGLFRLMFPDAHQLSGGEITKHLKHAVDKHYSESKPAIYVAQKQVAQLVDWVDGAHFYRHEPGTEEPAQPPMEMAIQYVAAGSSWLRWMATLDRPAS